MTLLGPDDPLPLRPGRVLVAGSSGSGKTTMVAVLAELWRLPPHELDALHHGTGWVPRPEFVADVTALAASAAWVTEWQYSAVRPLLLGRADLLVWLDLPKRVVFARLLRRTVLRRLRRTELWNGNREPGLSTIFTDRGHVVRWAWSTWPRTAERVTAALAAPGPPVVVRLRSAREVAAWLAGPASP